MIRGVGKKPGVGGSAVDDVKDFSDRLMANPVFWVAVVLCSLAGFISAFQQYVDRVSLF